MTRPGFHPVTSGIDSSSSAISSEEDDAGIENYSPRKPAACLASHKNTFSHLAAYLQHRQLMTNYFLGVIVSKTLCHSLVPCISRTSAERICDANCKRWIEQPTARSLAAFCCHMFSKMCNLFAPTSDPVDQCWPRINSF